MVYPSDSRLLSYLKAKKAKLKDIERGKVIVVASQKSGTAQSAPAETWHRF